MAKTAEEKVVSRRGFLANAGKIAAAAGIGAVGLSEFALKSTEAADTADWTYKPVDPEKVYWNGVAGYSSKACCQGAFDAIMQEMGEPFTSVPGYIMRFGEGGVAGMGSHCGALVGSSAAISLAFGGNSKVANPMITELTAWYMHDLGSGSQLCHTSVTEWCKANGVGVDSKERLNRCARVAGETAKKAVLLMNAQVAGGFKATLPTTAEGSRGCITCHGSSGSQTVRNGVALQDCTPCHTDEPHKQATN